MGACLRRGRFDRATELYHGALQVECSKDIIKLSSMHRLLDALLEVHRLSGDRRGLTFSQDSINTGLENLLRRGIDRASPVSYAALLQKIAEVLISASLDNTGCAASLLDDTIAYLQNRSEPVTVDGTSPSEDTQTAGQYERESLCLPRAGQQQLDVQLDELLPSIRQQRAALVDPS